MELSKAMELFYSQWTIRLNFLKPNHRQRCTYSSGSAESLIHLKNFDFEGYFTKNRNEIETDSVSIFEIETKLPKKGRNFRFSKSKRNFATSLVNTIYILISVPILFSLRQCQPEYPLPHSVVLNIFANGELHPSS